MCPRSGARRSSKRCNRRRRRRRRKTRKRPDSSNMPLQTQKKSADIVVGDAADYRHERIVRLLGELRYEIERGMLENEIDESLSFRFYVPISRRIPGGVVRCEFRTRPIL